MSDEDFFSIVLPAIVGGSFALGLILFALIPAARRCPHCRGRIPGRATVCRHCGRDL